MSAVHVALAPGETLLPGTRETLDKLFEDARVAAALLPLVPQGDRALPRAARRYLAAWDGRFLHDQNFYAPASRAAVRIPGRSQAESGWRNADAAPLLADALARGDRIVALREVGVATRIADDLAAWSGHFRAQGAAWAALARRDDRFARFAPEPWAKHVLAQATRRVGEVAEAMRRVDPLAWALHVARESSFASSTASDL